MPKDNNDYEALFKEALAHLQAVYASRNSFTAEIRDVISPHPMSNASHKSLQLRSIKVELMHEQAYEFLKEHTK